MADNKQRLPTSSFFSSPKLFTAFTPKLMIDTESVMSPTSILDTKPFSYFKNTPSISDSKTIKNPEPKSNWKNLDSRTVCLGLVDALTDEKSDQKLSKPDNSRMVLFGSQLKIQIPPLPPSVSSPVDSPRSPADFGIKTRNSPLGSFSGGFSPSPAKKSANFCPEIANSRRILSISTADMELSEDYTRVILRGPVPKTTLIYDDCVVERFDGVVADRAMSYPSESFLSFCCECKKNIGQGKDIYMYRGEKAFCSSECRYKAMMMEEEMEKSESDDAFGTPS